MIGRLTGVVALESDEGSLVLEVGGVGYELVVPLGAFGRARALSARGGAADGAGPVTFHVHTHVREDALSLYGFATAEDKAAFRTLISISNVGPKVALSLLSAMSAEDLADAVMKKDLARLVAVPGVGKKTAERLLLELKDKLARPPARPAAPASAEAPRAAEPSRAELLFGALTRLGYRAGEAERVIAQLGGRLEHEPIEGLVREALSLLAR